MSFICTLIFGKPSLGPTLNLARKLQVEKGSDYQTCGPLRSNLYKPPRRRGMRGSSVKEGKARLGEGQPS